VLNIQRHFNVRHSVIKTLRQKRTDCANVIVTSTQWYFIN